MTAPTAPQHETGTATCPFRSGAAPAADSGLLRQAPRRAVFSSAAARRVVLDTNVLLSLWVFADSRYATLRDALEDGRWQALTSEACYGEFARVLAYPQFALAPEAQRAALDDYRQRVKFIAAPAAPTAPLPRCRDGDDQKFLEVARDGEADWLVTADKALLALARRRKLAHLFDILTPDAALSALSAPQIPG